MAVIYQLLKIILDLPIKKAKFSTLVKEMALALENLEVVLLIRNYPLKNIILVHIMTI